MPPVHRITLQLDVELKARIQKAAEIEGKPYQTLMKKWLDEACTKHECTQNQKFFTETTKKLQDLK
jgi:uncharacterized protein (DUF1778 family)